MEVTLTQKTAKVFETIKSLSGNFTAADVAAKMGIEKPIAIQACITSLVKKGLVEKKVAKVKDAEGKDKDVKFLVVTANGKSAKVTVA